MAQAEAGAGPEPEAVPEVITRHDDHKLDDFDMDWVLKHLERGICAGCHESQTAGKFCERCMLCETCTGKHACKSERQYEWCFACEHDEGDVPTPEVQDVLDQLRSACGEHFLILESFASATGKVWIIKISCPEHYLRLYADKIGFQMRLRVDETLNLPDHGGPKDFVGVIPYVNHNPEAFAINRFPLEPGERERRGYYLFDEPGDILADGRVSFPLSCQQDQIFWDADETEDDTVRPEDQWTTEQKVSTLFSSGERQQLIKKMIESPLGLDGANIDMAVAEKNHRLKKAGKLPPVVADVEVQNPMDGDEDDDDEFEEPPTTISCIMDSFPLHDTYELAYLKRNWTTMEVPKQALLKFDLAGMTEVPLDSINDYFGAQVAFYFAFLRLYTNYLVYPAVLGVLTMAGHVLDGVESNPITPLYCVLIALWAILFLAKWRTVQLELQYRWGTESYEQDERPRKEFLADVRNKQVKNEFTNKLDIEHPTGMGQAAGKFGSTMTIFTCMITVILAAIVAMWIKLFDFAFASIVGSIFNVFCIQFFGIIYGKVAVKLNNYENYRTETAYQDSLIVKNFLFQFVNNYFALFFIAFLKEGEIFGKISTCKSQIVDCDSTDKYVIDNSTSTCITSDGSSRQFGSELDCKYTCIDGQMEVTSCMAELQIQLFVVFAVKQFALQLVEVLLPFVKAKKTQTMEFIKVRGMGAGAKRRAMVEYERPGARARHYNRAIIIIRRIRIGRGVIIPHPDFVTDYGGVFMDYNELAIQFGCPGRPGRLNGLSVSHSKSVLYGAFVWARRARRALNS
jgi:hypothetical protein